MWAKNEIEDRLRKKGFSYIFLGPLCERGLYESNRSELGDAFFTNLVPVKFNGYREDVVLRPEGTYGTIAKVASDSFENKTPVRRIRKKLFYSEEFVRAESVDRILKGGTRAFIQTGFEIVGYPLEQANAEVLRTCKQCITSLLGPRIIMRVGDKGIVRGIMRSASVEEQRITFENIDLSKENAPEFLRLQKDSGLLEGKKDKGLASSSNTIAQLLTTTELSLEISKKQFFRLARTILGDYPESMQALERLDDLLSKLGRFQSGSLVRPTWAIGKTFDSYDNMVFEVLGPYRDVGALAGGGDYTAMGESFRRELGSVPTMTGAGIGLTRLVDTMLRMQEQGESKFFSYSGGL